MRSISDIAHEFKIKYGLSPSEPTKAQLIEILNRTADWENRHGGNASDSEIEEIVRAVCPSTGKYKYASLGYQYMRDLLVQLQQQLNK